MAADSPDTNHGLACEMRDRVMWLALDRPRAANAVDAALARAFAGALAAAEQDAAVGAVVMTGGGRVFSAGIDIRNPDGLGHESLSALRRDTVTACLLAIVGFDKPLVAAVNGPAVGLGCMLALLADRVIAAEDAALSLPEIDIGIPTFLGMSIVARAAGGAIARDLVLTGRRMSAPEALQRGLVAEVVAGAGLAAAAQHAAESLAAKPRLTYALDKRWLARGLSEELAAANEQSRLVQPQLAREKHH